nr:E3 ubiquitin-protein ligase RFI2-like isoform X4 [Ipomoea batatas]
MGLGDMDLLEDDCIGSAFNAKGAMQCPNCRKVEKGQWLYASGHRSLPEFSMDDWAHDEDLSFCIIVDHDLLGQHAVFAEHTAVSSSSHPCPYIAYVGIHPTSSNSNGSVSDGPNFNNHWSSSAVPNEIPTTYAFPGMDVHYHGWEHHHSSSFPTSSSRIGNTDQPSIPSVSQRAARTNSDIPRPGSFVHPFLVSHSSGRPGSSVASSMIPPYPGSVARARDRRRSNSHRVVPQVGPVASSSDQAAGGFYFYPSASSGRSFQEAENPNRYHSWEREHLPAFNLPQQQQQVERDQIWGPYHQAQAGSGSDSGIRSGNFRQRHGSERMPSQNRLYTVVGGPEMTLFSRPHGCMHVMAKRHLQNRDETGSYFDFGCGWDLYSQNGDETGSYFDFGWGWGLYSLQHVSVPEPT